MEWVGDGKIWEKILFLFNDEKLTIKNKSAEAPRSPGEINPTGGDRSGTPRIFL
jgi:hypothetical protein